MNGVESWTTVFFFSEEGRRSARVCLGNQNQNSKQNKKKKQFEKDP